MFRIAESFFPLGLLFMVMILVFIIRGLAGAGRRGRYREGPPWRKAASDLPDPYGGPEAGAGAWRCNLPNCRAVNPPHARYCRMCGAKRAYR